MLKNSSVRYKNSGFTLIEVLTSIALLATLLSVSLVAIGRETKQTRMAQDRLQALEIADNLLELWLVENGGSIDSDEGEVAGHPNWRWRLAGKFEPGLEPFSSHLGRLEVYKVQTGASDEALMASLEFISNSPTTARLIDGKGR